METGGAQKSAWKSRATLREKSREEAAGRGKRTRQWGWRGVELQGPAAAGQRPPARREVGVN